MEIKRLGQTRTTTKNIEIGKIRKIWRFTGNDFWKNIGCIILVPTFNVREDRMCDKYQEIKKWNKKVY